MTYSILGIGAPIVDYIVEADNAFIKNAGGEKGGMELISFPRFQQLLAQSPTTPIIIAGGSATNTIKGLANLGHSCALSGKISHDPAGKLILKTLKRLSILPLHVYTETPTGLALCMITPDRERTMRTYVGAFSEMKGDDLKPHWFKGVKLVHIEGYTLLNEDLTERAMHLAKEAGALVSFDLASFEIATRFKERIVHLLVRYVDILFANQFEAETFTGVSDPEKGVEILKDMCDTAVVFMGHEGGWAANRTEKLRYPAFMANPIDTTGAGDLFASGFLHGILNKHPLAKCAHLGAQTASAVVGVYGTEIPEDKWSILNHNS